MQLQLEHGQQVAICVGDKRQALTVERSDDVVHIRFSPSMAALLFNTLRRLAERGQFDPSMYTQDDYEMRNERQPLPRSGRGQAAMPPGLA